jgi:cytochrome c-type biogenesis protein CcmH/NrfF
VFEELDDEAIVQMIQSVNVEGAVDSDEDEADDCVDVTTSKAQALQLASDLHEFALAQPQLLDASDVAVLHSMRGALAKCVEAGKKRATLTDMFAARRQN